MKKISSLVALCLITINSACAQKQDNQRLNHLQFIGSHNSYKQAIDPPLLKLLLAKDSGAIGLDYGHINLKDQLDLGLRGLEIDVSHDPTGGRYQNPRGIEWAKNAALKLPAHDSVKILSQPGMKVLHVADIDFKTNCLTFKNCLNEIKSWSDSHTDHLPIIITINTKDSGLEIPGATKVLPFGARALDSLDAEILAVIPMRQLIVPKLVKGNAKSLREAILTKGWPTVNSLRGKIMFVLDSPEGITKTYFANGKDRPMFVNVAEENPNAAFFIMNEPVEQKSQIQALLRKGFMVRTRADADTKEARISDYTRFEAAKASGAQLISTDYYLAKLSPNKTFEISFDGGTYVRDNDFTYLQPIDKKGKK